MMNLGLISISELPIVEDKFIYELYGINWYCIMYNVYIILYYMILYVYLHGDEWFAFYWVNCVWHGSFVSG